MQARRVAPLVLVGVLLAGCGGSARLSKAQYEAKARKDGAAVAKTIATIDSGSSSLASLAKEVGVAETSVKAAADDLAEGQPPADAAADNAKIVAALRAIAVQLDKLKVAAAKGDLAAAQAAATNIQNAPEVKSAEAATKDLQAKGYDIGAIGG